MAKIIQIFVVLALALLVVQAASDMNNNERRNIKNWVSQKLMTVQNKFETLHDGTVKPLAKKLYEKIFLKIAKSLLSNDEEMTIYKGKNKPYMIGNMNGKFQMEIM